MNFNFIKHIPLNFRTGFILVLCFIPYYYLALFLFHNNIPFSNIPIVLSVCFSLSLTWLMANYITAAVTIFVYQILERDFENKPEERLHTVTGLSILFLSFSFFVSYLTELSFRSFLCLSYILIIVRILIDVIPFLYYTNKPKNSNNKSN